MSQNFPLRTLHPGAVRTDFPVPSRESILQKLKLYLNSPVPTEQEKQALIADVWKLTGVPSPQTKDDAPQSIPVQSKPSNASCPAENLMMETDDTNTVWGNSSLLRTDIKTVTFGDARSEAPSTAWDVSAAQNRRVLAWTKLNGALYDLYIAGDGGVRANSNCYCLFKNFRKLETVYFSDCFDTSNVIDMEEMFYNCSSLTSLDLSGFDTSNVTDMEAMFCKCSSLTSLDLFSFDTSNVTDMIWMFANCSSLASLDLSSFDTSNVTADMSWMFANCSSLASLDLSGFDTSNVTDMNHMFSKCSNLTSLDLSSFNTSNVTDMNHMFSKCSSLTSLNLSSFDTSNVTNMSSIFDNCSSLTSLDLSSFVLNNTVNLDYIFDDCPAKTQWKLVKGQRAVHQKNRFLFF